MKDTNPYKPILTESTLGLDSENPEARKSSAHIFLLSVARGTASALLLFALCPVLGSHGHFPAIGFYIFGPSIWFWRLNISDLPYISELPFLFVLVAAMCVQWAAYWWYATVGVPPRPAARLLVIISVHVASVACYQFTFGLY